jgi:hypothetical protein
MQITTRNFRWEDLLLPIYIYLFIHMCIHCLGHFSPLTPPPPRPSSSPLPLLLPRRTCSALFSNFVEEKTCATIGLLPIFKYAWFFLSFHICMLQKCLILDKYSTVSQQKHFREEKKWVFTLFALLIPKNVCPRGTGRKRPSK